MGVPGGGKSNRLVFACFAVAILCATLREWSAPTACVRIMLPAAVRPSPSR
jgi:hypothetical protein